MRDSDVGSNPAAIIICRIGGTGIRTRLRTVVLRVRLPYPVLYVDCGLMAGRQIVALTIGVRFSSVNLMVT